MATWAIIADQLSLEPARHPVSSRHIYMTISIRRRLALKIMDG